LWRFGQRATPMRLLSIALACALAVSVKFSGLLFGWLLLIGLMVRAIQNVPWSWRGRVLATRGARVMLAITVCAIVGLICWGMIWAVYGFRFSIAPDESIQMDRIFLIREAKLQRLESRL